MAATLSLARSDRRIAATIEQWDSDPWLLNTPGGIVDLSAGQSRLAIPQDYMTKMTAVAPGGDCPRFSHSLMKLPLATVHCATFSSACLVIASQARPREHGLFFFYGTGANGKSVLLNTVSGILGDYHPDGTY